MFLWPKYWLYSRQVIDILSFVGVKVRSLSEDLDKSSNPVSPLKLSPRGQNDNDSSNTQDAAEDRDKDDPGGSDEVRERSSLLLGRNLPITCKKDRCSSGSIVPQKF